MISPDLKVGDTVIDGPGKFKVLEVISHGYYRSERIGNADSKDIPFAPAKDETIDDTPEAQLDSFNTYTKTEINRLSVAELEKVCAKLDLPVGTGVEMKKAIIAKLDL